MKFCSCSWMVTRSVTLGIKLEYFRHITRWLIVTQYNREHFEYFSFLTVLFSWKCCNNLSFLLLAFHITFFNNMLLFFNDGITVFWMFLIACWFVHIDLACTLSVFSLLLPACDLHCLTLLCDILKCCNNTWLFILSCFIINVMPLIVIMQVNMCTGNTPSGRV